MGEAMKSKRIPGTDSIEELARFWDSHDVTELEDQLEEVREPVFQGQPSVSFRIRLSPEELESLRRIASERGLEEAALLREWVLEKLHGSKPPSRGARRS